MSDDKKKTILVFLVLVLVSLLNTLFLNWYFINRISLNPFRYLKAVLKIRPFWAVFTTLNLSALLSIILSFLFECMMWGTFIKKGVLDTFFKRNSTLYGSALWLSERILKKKQYFFESGSGCVWGQTNEAVFKERREGGEKAEEIKREYDEKIARARETGKSEEELKDLEKERERVLKAERTQEVKEGRHLLGRNEFCNTMIIGGVGSCKTQGTIIPTLLSWKESVIVNDPKGELFETTAGYRSKFSDVYYMSPTDLTSTFCLNFFDWVPLDENCVNAIKGISEILIQVNENSPQPYFDRNAQEVFEILCLDTIVYGKYKSIGELFATFRADQSSDLMEYFRKIKQKTDDPASHPYDEKYRVLFNELKNNIGAVLKEHPETFQSVVSTLQTHLKVFTNRKIISITNTTTITPEQFQKTDRPVSIYITTPTADVERNKALLNLVFSAIILKLTEREVNQKDIKNRVLFVLDEFYQLGYMKTVQTTIPIARGYGLLFMIAIQSISQLQSVYGDKEAISMFENFSVKDIKKVGEPQTAEWVKQQIGRTTITKERKSRSKSFGGFFSHGRTSENLTTSSEEVGRDLITPDEIMRLEYDEQILIISGVGAYKGKKVHSFEDGRFKDKYRLPFRKNDKKLEIYEVESGFSSSSRKETAVESFITEGNRPRNLQGDKVENCKNAKYENMDLHKRSSVDEHIF